MEVDHRDLAWCRLHVELCRRLSRTFLWTPLSFFVARARRTFDRRLPQEAYWAAAEAEGIGVRAHPGAPELYLDPDAAWALLAAMNERLGRALFYGFHPMGPAEHARVWHRIREAVELLAKEPLPQAAG